LSSGSQKHVLLGIFLRRRRPSLRGLTGSPNDGVARNAPRLLGPPKPRLAWADRRHADIVAARVRFDAGQTL
jgi:hypothetical protein